MRHRLNTTVALLAGLAMMAAACGSDGGGGGGGNPVGPGRTWTLTVSVTSEQKQPVRSATVRILDGSDASKTATTDDSGTAVMYSLKEGSFSIEVTATEYYRSTASVSLTTSTTVAVALKERNRAPVLTSLVAQGTDPGQPAGMTDVGDTIAVTANVSDKETPIAGLTFAWTADTGTVTGTGNAVQWRAPATGSTPFTATINVTITERFTAPGSTTPEENVTKGEVKVRVHDSPREAGAVARNFLLDFSDSTIPASTVISRHFATGSRCEAGRSAELNEVTVNRTTYRITSHTIGQPTAEIHFHSSSPFRARDGDAWIGMSCGWTSTVLATNKTEVFSGICRLTAVYEAGQWALCWSEVELPASALGKPSSFMR
jgi:hypothetical protein